MLLYVSQLKLFLGPFLNLFSSSVTRFITVSLSNLDPDDSKLSRDEFLRSNSKKLVNRSNWTELWNTNSTTFIIVRHPLARLGNFRGSFTGIKDTKLLILYPFLFCRIVSFYFNKLERNGHPHEDWEIELSKKIIQFSRQDEGDNDAASTPTPADLVK